MPPLARLSLTEPMTSSTEQTEAPLIDGARVREWSQLAPGAPAVPTGREGVVETITAESQHRKGLKPHQMARDGDRVVRVINYSCEPTANYVRFDANGRMPPEWLPVKQRPTWR